MLKLYVIAIVLPQRYGKNTPAKHVELPAVVMVRLCDAAVPPHESACPANVTVGVPDAEFLMNTRVIIVLLTGTTSPPLDAAVNVRVVGLSGGTPAVTLGPPLSVGVIGVNVAIFLYSVNTNAPLPSNFPV